MEPRPIDANVLLEVFEEMKKVADGDYRVPFSIIGQTVRDAKTLDYAPVRHGEWVGVEFDGYADGCPVYEIWECSECKGEHKGDYDTLTDYCPNCGAKMDAKEE